MTTSPTSPIISLKDLSKDPIASGISFVLAMINTIPLGIIVIYILYTTIHSTYTKSKHKFISNKPSSMTLLYSPFIDLLFFITANWWFIKMCCLFETWGVDYCDGNYDRSNCDADDLCEFGDNSLFDDSNGNISPWCHRRGTHPYYGLFTSWCVFWVVYLFYELIMGIVCCADDGPNKHKEGCRFLPVIASDCWIFCGICTCEDHFYDDLRDEYYERAGFWNFGKLCLGDEQSKNMAPLHKCKFWVAQFFSIGLGRYGIQILFGSIYYGMITNDIGGDYALFWYDYWIIIVLVMIKFGLQIHYIMGEAWDDDAKLVEQYATIVLLLEDKFESDVAQVIRSYMDFFYNEKCPNDMRLELKQEEKSYTVTITTVD